MEKIILLNSLIIIVCLSGIYFVSYEKKRLEDSKPQWLKIEENRRRYIIPVDEYIANQEKKNVP